MKLKLFSFEFEFDKDDAQIVIPIVVLALSLYQIDFGKEYQFIAVVLYYLLFFFYKKWVSSLRSLYFEFRRSFLRCPNCKSDKLILQGYGTHHSDEHHAFYLCLNCKTTSILTEGGLTCK